MRRIISFSTRNKLAIWLLTIIVIVAGIYAGTHMKMETMPDLNIPVVSISTGYQGATPDDIDNKITQPIEEKVRNLPGVQNVSSTSSSGMSSVQVEYDYNKDMDKAVSDVKEAIDQISLPDNAQKPNVLKADFNAFPVYSISVTGQNQSLATLTDKVEKDLVPAIEGVGGVSSVTTSGQQIKDIQIAFKSDQLKKYGLSQDTVTGLIKNNNVSSPLGLYTIDKKEKSVVVSGNIKSADDLKNIEIPIAAGSGSQTAASQGSAQSSGQGQSGQSSMPAAQSGQSQGAQGAAAAKTQLKTIKLKDVADVTLEKKAESYSRTNGKESIGVSIVKSQDANTVDVVNGVKAKISKFEKEHPGTKVVSMFDQGKPIQQSVNTMVEKAIYGAIFAMLVILLFLRNIRTTLISVISIPLSLLIALTILNQMGITLNIMTLGALTIAIGRVVDDSIVVIENIYRRMSLSTEKLRGKELIKEATHEMFIPIMSSTIVTIAVFLPMALVSGMVGQIFLPFALTIVFSLLASLLVAITVVPMMADGLFKRGLKKKKNTEEHPGKMAAFYRRVLNGALNHKILTFGGAVLVLVASLMLVPKIGASFLASDDEKEIIFTFNPNPGETVSDAKKVARQAEKYLESSSYMTKMQYSIGGSSSEQMFQAANNQALFFVSYKKSTPDFEKFQTKTLNGLKKLSNKGEWKIQDFGSGGSDTNTLTLYVYGDSMSQLKPVVNDVENLVKKDHHFANTDSSLSQSYDQYTIVANQEKLGQYGLSAGQIAQTLMGSSTLSNSQALTTIKQDGKDLDVYVKPDKQNDDSINDLTNQTVASSTGQQVKIKDVAKVEKGTSANSITKRNGKFYAEVTAKVTAKDVSKATQDLKKKVDKLDIPKNTSVSFSGVSEQMNDSFSQLGLAMLAAIAIVYFVLVVTFGGGLAPLAILFSLPFAVIGSLVALLISGETISVSSMIGALMLIGIVITNAVVLIDRVIHKEKEGLPTRQALLEAAGTRLRPILMTAIATICALLPLAFGMEGSGGLISKGLAVTVIGGIASSTLLTLVIVPIVYETLMKIRHKRGKKTEEKIA